jgi:hypothetical protein
VCCGKGLLAVVIFIRGMVEDHSSKQPIECMYSPPPKNEIILFCVLYYYVFPKVDIYHIYFPNQNQINYKTIKPLLGKSTRILSEIYKHGETLMPRHHRFITGRLYKFGEEGIYSHEFPKMDEIIKDLTWESSLFVEYRSPFTRKETLPLGNNSSQRNIHNSSAIDNQRNEIKTSIYV